jgi:hypothetical protein
MFYNNFYVCVYIYIYIYSLLYNLRYVPNKLSLIRIEINALEEF